MTEKDQGQIEWMPITQAAEKSKISRNKLWKMVTEGKLAAWIAPPWDERLTLVDMGQLQLILEKRKNPKTALEAEPQE
jgi:hypothetical protein